VHRERAGHARLHHQPPISQIEDGVFGTPAQATAILQDLRAASPYEGRTFELAARIEDPKAPFYLRLRDLVVFGYFTSEIGSTKELRYVAVPGRFDGDVDIKTWPYQNVI